MGQRNLIVHRTWNVPIMVSQVIHSEKFKSNLKTMNLFYKLLLLMNSSAELARDKKDFTSKSINKTLNKCRIFSSNDHAIYLALSFHISGNLLKKKCL